MLKSVDRVEEWHIKKHSICSRFILFPIPPNIHSSTSTELVGDNQETNEIFKVKKEKEMHVGWMRVGLG